MFLRSHSPLSQPLSLTLFVLLVASWSALATNLSRTDAATPSVPATWQESIRQSRDQVWTEINNSKLNKSAKISRWNEFWNSLRRQYPELAIERYSQTVREATSRLEPAGATELFVSVDGDDGNDGSSSRPFATIARARDAIRTMKKREGRLTRPVKVVVRGGIYHLSQTIEFGPEDSGTATYPIVYEAAKGQKVVLSGGQSITTPWRTDDGKVFDTDLPREATPWRFRQLFVNGSRQWLARFPNFDPSDVTGKGWLYVTDPVPQTILFGLDKKGDFVTYRFRAPADGRYTIWLGYCTVFDAAHKNLDLKIDGEPVGAKDLPTSGGWRDVKFMPVATLDLTQGEHTLRLDNIAGSKGASRSWMRIHLDAFILTDNPDFRIFDGHPQPASPQNEHRVWIQAEDDEARIAGFSSNGFDTAPIPLHTSADRLLVDQGLVHPSWSNAPQAEVFVFATWGWYNEIARLTGIEAAAPLLSTDGQQRLVDVLQLEGAQLRTRLLPQNRFFVFNLHEELDAPGEWFLDYDTGRLSYIPADGSMEELDVVAPRLMRIFELSAQTEGSDRVEHVVLRGFHLQHTDYSTDRHSVRSTTDCAILLKNCWNCAVEDCTFTNIGGYGIRLHMDSCLNRIVGNTITESGAGGIILTAAYVGWPGQNPPIESGEMAERYAPIANLIAKNHVHHCGRYLRYNAGVHTESRPAHMVHAVGNVYTGNHIHHLPRNGIFCFAQQAGHVIEHNHLHDLLLESDDGGAIHLCVAHHPDSAQTLIRNNLIRDIIGFRYRNAEHTNAHGVYLDGATSNVRVTHNVIQNTRKGCVFYHLGVNNVVENNILADDRLAQVWLAKDWKGNCFRRNIVSWSTPEPTYFLVQSMDRRWNEEEASQFERNLIWHAVAPVAITFAGRSDWLSDEFPDGEIDLRQWQAEGFERDSLVADPLFLDPHRPERGLKPNSPAWKLGFEPIQILEPLR